MCTLWVMVATAQIIYDLDDKKDKKRREILWNIFGVR